jgi:hypothetical protein
VPGEGYFPASDGTAFVMIDGPLSLEGTDTSEGIAAAAEVWLSESLVGYTQTNAAHADNTTHLAFVAMTPEGEAGRGSILARRLAGQSCSLIFFALESASLPYEPTLGSLHTTFSAANLAPPPVAVVATPPPATTSPTNYGKSVGNAPTPIRYDTPTPRAPYAVPTRYPTSTPYPTYPPYVAPTRYPTSTPYPTSPPYVAPSTGGGGSGGSSGCGSRGGPGGPRTSSGKCPAWPKK